MNVSFCYHVGGGFVVTPINHGKKSVVKHMLAIDWKFWRSYLRKGSARSITICMLGRVAGTVILVKRNATMFSIKDFWYWNLLFYKKAYISFSLSFSIK